ncbi:T9SS type A sorting domain-containing protein, partial [Bacteroidales bacterium OttesenSCG-928-M11]|nr:T9SS type A sorting domain-containing protein [Bacteroidales bacterium OttesenSCG-928-M11]
SSDATLKSLKVGDEEILVANKFAYDFELPEGTTTLPTITYEKNHEKATIGTVTLPTIAGIEDESNNKAIIPVTAENGTEKEYTITFTITVELEPLESLFETFVGFTEGGSNPTNNASPSSKDTSAALDTCTINPGWTGEKIYQAGGMAKMGGSSALGWIQTPAIDLSGNEGKFTLSFDAMAWKGDSTTLKVYLNDVLVHTAKNLGNTDAYEMSSYSVVLTGGTASSKIKFEGAQASKGRFFLDNVKVTSGTVVEPIPVINITPTYISFSTVELNAPESKTATVTGVDLKEKITYEITGDGKDAFKVETTDWNDLTGGGFVITFTPTEAKYYSAAIEVKSDGATDNAIYLEGTGVAPIVDDESVIVRFNGYTQGNPPTDGIFLAKGGNDANKGIATLTREAAGFTYAVNQDGVAASQGWDGADEVEKYWIATFSSIGVNNLKLTSKQRGSNTSPKDFKIQYKVGTAETWTDLKDGVVEVANDEYIVGKIENLDLPEALSNQASVSLRWLCTSTTRISGDDAVPTGGVNRLDVVITQGDAPILSDNNNLKSLSVSKGTLEPAFDPAVLTYSVVLSADETEIPSVTYELEDETATAVLTEATTLPGKTTIVVTSESGLKKTYAVAFRNATPAGVWMETFETGLTKNSYAIGDFQGTACLWEVFGVINKDDNDKVNGTQAVRLRDPNNANATPHYLMMKEDKANGAGTITLYHGMYGTHENGAYTLEVSNDGGKTWAKSFEVEEIPAALTETSFEVNMKGNIRIKITKATPQIATCTINIDDITISDYDGSNINDIDNNAIRVYASDDMVYVNNVEAGAQISIYDITGKLVVRTTDTTIPVSSKGIYIVKVNAKAYKIVNK